MINPSIIINNAQLERNRKLYPCFTLNRKIENKIHFANIIKRKCNKNSKIQENYFDSNHFPFQITKEYSSTFLERYKETKDIMKYNLKNVNTNTLIHKEVSNRDYIVKPENKNKSLKSFNKNSLTLEIGKNFSEAQLESYKSKLLFTENFKSQLFIDNKSYKHINFLKDIGHFAKTDNRNLDGLSNNKSFNWNIENDEFYQIKDVNQLSNYYNLNNINFAYNINADYNYFSSVLSNRIINYIEQMNNTNTKNLNIKINLRLFGKIHLYLSRTGDRIRINIRLENKELRNILQSSQNLIKKQLESKGINVSNFKIIKIGSDIPRIHLNQEDSFSRG